MPGSTAGALRTYRTLPTPVRAARVWAAGCHQPRGAAALFALKDEMGYPSLFPRKTWGFQDVLSKAAP